MSHVSCLLQEGSVAHERVGELKRRRLRGYLRASRSEAQKAASATRSSEALAASLTMEGA